MHNSLVKVGLSMGPSCLTTLYVHSTLTPPFHRGDNTLAIQSISTFYQEIYGLCGRRHTNHKLPNAMFKSTVPQDRELQADPSLLASESSCLVESGGGVHQL